MSIMILENGNNLLTVMVEHEIFNQMKTLFESGETDFEKILKIDSDLIALDIFLTDKHLIVRDANAPYKREIEINQTTFEVKE